MSSIQIATDGSCIQQGGFAKGDATDRPGASGFVAKMPDGKLVGKATPFANGTIGEMEIKGLRMGLEFAAAVAGRTEEAISIKCDSQFVVNGFNDWLDGWAAKNYHKKGGLTGADDWRAIDALKQSLGSQVKVQWVKGHSGDPLNERVDGIVNGAARTQRAYDTTSEVLASTAPIARGPSGLDPNAGPNPLAHVDRISTLPDSAEFFGSTSTAPSPESTVKFMNAQNAAIDDDRIAEATAPFLEGRKGGLQAQASALLSKAAEDPRLARLLAQGLEMALDETRNAGHHDRDVVDQATILQSVLQQRGGER